MQTVLICTGTTWVVVGAGSLRVSSQSNGVSETHRSGVLVPKMPVSPTYTRWFESIDFT